MSITAAYWSAAAQTPAEERILGKWINQEQNVVLDFYQKGDTYFGRISWLKDSERLDSQNADAKLQSRRLRGTDVVINAAFDTNSQSWTNGKLYNFTDGTTTNCQLWLDTKQQNTLYLKGYGYFAVLGNTSTWTRPTESHPVYKGH